MSKPEDISPDLIDAADKVLSDAWKAHDADFNPHSNSISDGLWGKFVTATARAILAAKAEEREACAELCGGLRHDDRSSENEDWVAGTFACQAAIRKRGEPKP